MINNTSYPDKAIHEFSTKAVDLNPQLLHPLPQRTHILALLHQGLLYLVPLHLQGRQGRLDGDELGAEGGEFVGLGRGAFAEGGNSGLFGV
ncbi:unnamed protein product [Tilletia controversa]|nr:unnamed protein product [Tilletia controversa]